MYFDNASEYSMKSVKDVSMTEILQSELQCSEVEGAGELYLMQQEGIMRINGLEAPSDWWEKIKQVARRILEAFKNLANKIFTFIKLIPTRIANFVKKIILKWEKLGMKSKIEHIRKMKNVEYKTGAFRGLQERAFGISVISSNEKVINPALGAIEKDLEAGANKILSIVGSNSEDAAEDASSASIEAENNARKKFDSLRSAITDTEDLSQFIKNANNAQEAVNLAEKCYSALVSGSITNEAKKQSIKAEGMIKKCANAIKMAENDLDKARRADNQEQARADIVAMKVSRRCSSLIASYSSKINGLYITKAINTAKIANACIAAIRNAGTPAAGAPAAGGATH